MPRNSYLIGSRAFTAWAVIIGTLFVWLPAQAELDAGVRTENVSACSPVDSIELPGEGEITSFLVPLEPVEGMLVVGSELTIEIAGRWSRDLDLAALEYQAPMGDWQVGQYTIEVPCDETSCAHEGFNATALFPLAGQFVGPTVVILRLSREAQIPPIRRVCITAVVGPARDVQHEDAADMGVERMDRGAARADAGDEIADSGNRPMDSGEEPIEFARGCQATENGTSQLWALLLLVLIGRASQRER